MTLFILYLAIIICGVAQAFWGYRLRRIFRFFPGLLAGALTGGTAGLLAAGTAGAVILGLILGVLFGIIGIVWEKVSIFIEFFDYGFVVTAFLLARATLSSLDSIAAIILTRGSSIIVRVIIPAVIVGCIAGALGLRVSRVWIIFSTAFWGGIMFTVPISIVFPFGVVGLLMIPAGIVYQLKTTGISLKKGTGEQAGQPVPPQPQMAPNVELPKGPQEKMQPMGQNGPAAMFCSQCGGKIGADAAFCPKCGSKVG